MDTSVKIVSNPYEKTVEFFLWKVEWQQITKSNAPKSKLVSDELVHGFFPFKAKEIVDIIVSEFRAKGQSLIIEFEGPSDEYDELQSVCEDEEYAGILSLGRSGRRLPNARDVLPGIVEVFDTIRPIISDDAMKDKKIAKFYEASSDLVPICVLGNYSAGKSTFINALIGGELLPSGDEPVTSKVYEIKRSRQQEHGTISFELDGIPFSLQFDDMGLVRSDSHSDSLLYQGILSALEAEQCAGCISSMSSVLRVVNAHEAERGVPGISNLIRIEVPFSTVDSWVECGEFVIFDTPGSNSKTNEDHKRVLHKAMEGLSNGLPIFVAEYGSLDSEDNSGLYDEIREIEALDERFAMIVVNKADSASLPKGGFGEEQVQRILDQAIPRSLYAQGIYFVSSIMGLGFKNRGVFEDEFYDEKFYDHERKFSDPSGPHYKALYRFNILPGQMRERAIAESEECPDLVLANSGLYCVEREIVLFAKRYSAYNKCQQSKNLLSSVIEKMIAEFEVAKTELEQLKQEREEALDKQKRALVAELEESGAHAEEGALAQYETFISDKVKREQWYVVEKQLREREAVLTAESKEGHDFETRDIEAREAHKAALGQFADSFFSALGTPEKGKIGAAFSSFLEKANDAGAKRKALAEVRENVDRETSDELLGIVRALFDSAEESIKETVDRISREYWSSRAESGRKALYDLATSSAILSEEKRQEVAGIIIGYEGLTFVPSAEKIFVKSELMNDFKILNLVILSSNKLNLGKVARVYNSAIGRAYDEWRASIKHDHEKRFKDWLAKLLAQIIDNITDYNPVLHDHAVTIREATEKINDLAYRLGVLESSTEQIASMIDWRE